MPRTSRALCRPAQQSRALKTSDAIISAGLDLLRDGDFEAVTVADIARKAGVSVGGFYARFEGKEALLHALAADVLNDCSSALDRALSHKVMARASVKDVLHAYVSTMVRKFRQHRNAIRQIIRHARAGDPLHGLAVRDFNDRVHGRLRALLQERKALIAHADPDFAINFGLFMVSAGAREAVLSDALRAYPIKVSDDALIAELTNAYSAYLAGAEHNRRKARATRTRRETN